MKTSFLLTVILIWVFYCPGQSLPRENKTVEIPASAFKLNNGLTVVVSEDASTPDVGVELWFRAGSRYEKAGQFGIAHLFEHIMPQPLRVTSNQENLTLYREQRLDGNAQTKNDYTRYYLKMPAASLDLAFAILADRMSNPPDVITQAELDKHRAIVLNEIRNAEGKSWDGEINNRLREGVFGASHPYGHSVYGNVSELKAATVETIRDWYSAYHGAANALMIVVGNVKTENVRKSAARFFGSIAPGTTVSRSLEWVPKSEGWRRDLMWHNVAVPKIYVNWTAPKFGMADADYLSLLENILAAGSGSRLHRRLVRDEGIADSVFTNSSFWESAGMFSIGANLKESAGQEKAEKIIREEINRALREGVTASEVEQAKARYKREFVENLQQLAWQGGRAEVLGEGWLFTGDPLFYRLRLKRIEQATAKDVSDAARRWLGSPGFVLEVNKKDTYQISAAVDRTSRINVSPPVAPTFPAIREKTLTNGLRILLIEKHNLPLVNISLLVNSRLGAGKNFQPGTGLLALNSLRGGTATKSPDQIENVFNLAGASLETSSDLNFSVVSLSTLKEKLSQTLPVFADVILHPVFSKTSFENMQSEQLDQIERDSKIPSQLADRVLYRMIYGEAHPYGQSPNGLGDEKTVRQITVSDLRDFHQTFYRPNNAALIIVGDVTMAEITPKLESLFGNWTRGNANFTSLPDVNPRAKPTIYLINQEGAAQSLITAAQVLPGVETSEMSQLNGVVKILAARLNLNLRESKRWTYGAWTNISDASGTRILTATAPVEASKTAEAMREIFNEFKILKEQPVKSPELKTTQRSLLRDFDISTLDGFSSLLTRAVRFGLPDNFYQEQINLTGKLVENDISTFAAKTITPDKLVWIVVADRRATEAALRDLGLGEVKIVEPADTK